MFVAFPDYVSGRVRNLGIDSMFDLVLIAALAFVAFAGCPKQSMSGNRKAEAARV